MTNSELQKTANEINEIIKDGWCPRIDSKEFNSLCANYFNLISDKLNYGLFLRSSEEIILVEYYISEDGCQEFKFKEFIWELGEYKIHEFSSLDITDVINDNYIEIIKRRVERFVKEVDDSIALEKIKYIERVKDLDEMKEIQLEKIKEIESRNYD